MLTSRFQWQGEKNQLIALRDSMIASGEPFIDFSESNPTKVGLDSLTGKNTRANILREIFTSSQVLEHLSEYAPDAQGLLSARRAISEYYSGCGINLSPEDIFLTSSTSEGYSYLFKLLSDPYQEILVPQPGYPLFDILAKMESLRLSYYTLSLYAQSNDELIDLDNKTRDLKVSKEMFQKLLFKINFETLIKELHKETRALVLVNPNNPTGNFISMNEIKHLKEILRSNSVPLIIDEVFIDYIKEEQSKENFHARIELSKCNGFLLNGFSKMLGLPQWKLAWIGLIGDKDWKDRVREPLSFILDNYLSPSLPAMLSASRLLQERKHLQNPIKKRIIENYDYLIKKTERFANFDILPYSGGWNCLLRINGMNPKWDEEKFAMQLLKDKKVFIMPGYFFDIEIPNTFIISLLLPHDLFCKGLKIILMRNS